MTIKLINILLCTLLLLVGSCQKVPLPEPNIGDPVFTFSGDLNGSSKTFAGGVDSFYMYSSYSVDDFSIYSFTGKWAIEENSQFESPESFSITLRDQEINEEGFFTDEGLESSLLRDNFNYSLSDSSGQIQAFNIFLSNQSFSSDEMSYSWTVSTPSNGNIIEDSGEANPFFQIPAFENVEICLNASTETNQGATFATHCRNIQLDDFTCEIDFELDFAGIDSLAGLNALVMDAIQYEWTINGGTTNNMESFQTLDSTGYYCVFISDENEKTCELCIDIDELGGFNGQELNLPIYTVAKFGYEIEPVFGGSAFDYSTVQIEYVSPDGVVYRSSDGPQNPDTTFFQVIEMSEYDLNELGQRTKKLTVQFDCTLYSPNQESIQINNANAIIAVAYP